MQRNELNDLLAFEAVARARSFTRAAAQLGMSPSAISHAMRGLEARLGVRLLARTTRSVAPTPEGELLLNALRPALDGIARGLETLASNRDILSGQLRLTTFATAAEAVLAPALPAFLLAHPNVSLEVSLDAGLTDIVAGGFDAGIRFGDQVAKDMVAVRVGPDLRTVVVGTPGYFTTHPRPESPADLEHHACLGYRLATSGGLLPWEFEKDGQAVKVRTRGPLVVNDGDLIASAVRAGVGLGYMLEHSVAADIAAGRLVQVLDDWCPSFPGFHLYHPSRRQTPPALKALIAALRWRG